MATNRIERINDDIKRTVSDMLRSIKDPRINQGMISVTRVDTTGDLRFAKVYLSVLGLRDEKELKKGLKSASGWMRRELGASQSLRYTPELIFELDHSIEHGSHINEIISGLNIEHDESEDVDDEDD